MFIVYRCTEVDILTNNCILIVSFKLGVKKAAFTGSVNSYSVSLLLLVEVVCLFFNAKATEPHQSTERQFLRAVYSTSLSSLFDIFCKFL